ncbi:hypothetical protein PIB30_032457 [Stylosanthes scabra]|uniref:MSP domain-containing protein n=1 Tax=Stylosanthes scabra TaxID=79078 RepID=A0ABU6RD35_9FABA|nr:hypothetical protein [Stylosanthes scabra]
MDSELLQIEPPHLTFVFELKKQSSCLVHLSNNASHHVAFKIKTTSPKKYCVRPTIGVINPHASCDFTVTMQPQRSAPPDFQCKDKFLIQSTIVPVGTTPDQISSQFFSKETSNYVEEKKLRVVLISPPSSPVLLPVNSDLNHHDSLGGGYKDRLLTPDGLENLPPSLTVAEEKSSEPAEDMEEDTTGKEMISKRVENNSESKIEIGMKQGEDDLRLSLNKDYEELKSRISIMDSKLREAEETIAKLTEERRANTREKDLLKLELEMLKRKGNMKRPQVGFPLLFVCVVALVSVTVGYYVHP